MDLTFPAILVLPFALGLLGFVEPCTVGAHLLFLNTVRAKANAAKAVTTMIFVAVRALVMGGIGAVVALVGQPLIDMQSALWLAFGIFYLAIGLAYATDRISILMRGIELAPAAWKAAESPALLGLAFGFSIPACAAPILVALFGLAAGSGALLIGFAVMIVYAAGLSVPLVALALVCVPAWLRLSRRTVRWLLAAVFVGVGCWSIWFSLYVDATEWTV